MVIKLISEKKAYWTKNIVKINIIYFNIYKIFIIFSDPYEEMDHRNNLCWLNICATVKIMIPLICIMKYKLFWKFRKREHKV